MMSFVEERGSSKGKVGDGRHPVGVDSEGFEEHL